MDEMGTPEGETMTVSVLIVDDQLPFRAVARTVIAMTTGFEVTAEAASAEEAIARVDAEPPDLVLMDINLPGMSGIEATRRIVEAHPQTAVILLSTYSEADLPSDAKDCGALAYVHKEHLDANTRDEARSSSHAAG